MASPQISSQQRKYAMKISGVPKSAHPLYEFVMSFIGGTIGCLGSLPFCFCCPNPYKIVQQGNVGLISKFGKCYQLVDAGLHQINPLTESIHQVSVKLNVVDIPSQNVLTKDNVGVHIDPVLYYRISDPYVAMYLVENVNSALIERTQAVMRQVVGARTLQECIENRESLSKEIKSHITEIAEHWGTFVESVLIKDITMPPEIVESLSAAAKQQRQGESKLIAAEAEVAAAELMRQASDILNTKAAMNIRYYDAVLNMARSSRSNVIFMPINFEDGDDSKYPQQQHGKKVTS